MRPRWMPMLLLLALSVVLVFGQTAGSGPRRDPRELVIGFRYDLDALDPKQLGPIETDIAYKIYSTLVRLKHGTLDEFVPDLAKSWQISPDGLVYTFNLRDDVTWHKGYGRFTAHDVKYSFERLKARELGSPHRVEAQGIREVAVVNDHTVQVRLVEPWPDFLAQWVAYRPGFIVNRKAIEELGDRYTESAVGTGAYTLERVSQREEVVLRRNPRYYGPAPYFNVLRYKIVLDLNVLAIGLQRGDVEIMYADDPAVAKRILGMKEVEKVRFSSDRTHYLWMNNKKYPFTDRRIRQAFWWGLDREEIVKAAWEGMATVTDTTSPLKDPNTLKGRVYSYNRDRAKQLLDEAKYDYNTRIPLAMTPGQEEIVGPLIQAQYARIGIKIDLVPMERLERVRQMATGEATLWHGARLRFLAAQQLEPYNAQWDRYAIGEEWRGRLQQASSERDPRKRRELYHSLQRYLLVEAPQIPLYYADWVLAWRSDLTGIVPGVGTFRIPEDTIRRR